MEELIVLLYLGFGVAALIASAFFIKAKPSFFKIYVLLTSVATFILLSLTHNEYQTFVLPDDNDTLILQFCLMIPFGIVATPLLFYHIVHLQRSHGRMRWFGLAILSLIALLISPILGMLIPTERVNGFTTLQFFNFMMGLAYLGIAIFTFGFVLGLSHHSISQVKRYILGMGAAAIALGTLWYWQMVANNDDGVALFYPMIFSVLLVVLATLTLHDLVLRQRQIERLLPAGLSVTVSLLFVWSPYMGSVGVFESCNAIHRWQLQPVVEGLQNYNRDSTRFPLGLQALQPFYIEEMPALTCFGSADHYRLMSCESTAVLEMDDFYGEEFHRLFLISGDWETSSDEPRTCGPMGG